MNDAQFTVQFFKKKKKIVKTKTFQSFFEIVKSPLFSDLGALKLPVGCICLFV
jgi:hypothetical protein